MRSNQNTYIQQHNIVPWQNVLKQPKEYCVLPVHILAHILKKELKSQKYKNEDSQEKILNSRHLLPEKRENYLSDLGVFLRVHDKATSSIQLNMGSWSPQSIYRPIRNTIPILASC